ncbi:hypothetical protein WJX72_003416 [[Myrmecia] bisecta]|uniref:Uncharacterized protein n=1 Tax=[Myrmecia] bisecta TaxID=41462 RepID=A0AAW1R5G2_9CHLO
MSDKVEVNHNHVLENFRQTVKREHKLAQAFEDTWGFMVIDEPSTSQTRPHATTNCKYINSRGGTWTVARKRIALNDREAEEQGCTPPNSSRTVTRTAREAARLTHTARLNHIKSHSAAYRTTNQCFGQRMSLEQFGVRSRKFPLPEPED